MYMLIAFAVASLTPEEADFYARELGRPLPARVRVETPYPMITAFGPGQPPFVIFMNRNGGTYTCGDEDSSHNRSTIACGASPAQVGDWPGSDAEWQQFMACSVDLFSRFNLTVTDVEPASGPYIEAVVGGSPGQVGMGGGVGGVAPYQCGVIQRAVVYAFADVYYRPGTRWWRSVCETAAQEVVHAFGLDHEYLCEDPMTYLDGCGDKTFQDVDARCGEFSPRSCDCTGATQNSVREMLELFGPSAPPVDDPVPPTVSLVSPQNGATLAAHTQITIVATATDNIDIRSVELEWDFSGNRFACPGSGQSFECTENGSTYTWTIHVGEGQRTYRVRVTDVGLNSAVSQDYTISLTPGGDAGGGGGDPGGHDRAAPAIIIGRPTEGAALPANSTVDVVATITDNSGVASASLLWAFNGETYACPLQSQYVTCAKRGNEYVWSLRVGAGARSFRVRARDAAGNTTETTPRSFELVEGATPPADDAREDNDTLDTASTLRCGETISLIATDADWFSLDVDAGLVVDANAGTNPIVAIQSGSSEPIASGTGSIRFTAPGPLFLAVLPTRADSGLYAISVTCTPPSDEGGGDTPDPRDDDPVDPTTPPVDADDAFPPGDVQVTTRAGCGQVGAASWATVALLAILLLRHAPSVCACALSSATRRPRKT